MKGRSYTSPSVHVCVEGVEGGEGNIYIWVRVPLCVCTWKLYVHPILYFMQVQDTE